jgi:hypothetical protein
MVKVHIIIKGTSKVGHYGEQAMLKAGGDFPLTPGQPYFDVLQEICGVKIQTSPL